MGQRWPKKGLGSNFFSGGSQKLPGEEEVKRRHRNRGGFEFELKC